MKHKGYGDNILPELSRVPRSEWQTTGFPANLVHVQSFVPNKYFDKITTKLLTEY
jgi:hypothetical protein